MESSGVRFSLWLGRSWAYHCAQIAAVVMVLLTGCGPVSPTTTAIPPTAPPAATPVRPTATAIPPTATPANAPPVIAGLANQTIPDDEPFPMLYLDDYVSDADHAVDEIAWSCTGYIELDVRLFETVRRLRVNAPSDDWRGAETLRLEACDPEGLCDSIEVVFAVLEENDPPVFQIVDQPLLAGETFSEINLVEHVSDRDNTPSEMTWRYSGNRALVVDITDGVLRVELPTADWRGNETIQVEACDPGGACTSEDVLYAVVEESDLLVTYVYNAGFLITTGGQKVLVDAISQDAPSTILTALQNAEPPFDGVDLVLCSHDHHDHFSPRGVCSHLKNNPKAAFVSTDTAVDALQRGCDGFASITERVISIDLEPQTSTQLTVNGIDLEIMEISHGDPTCLNLGYVITLGDYKLLHTGDLVREVVDVSYLAPYDIPGKEIDVAMIPHFVLIEEHHHPIVLEAIQARYLIPMHLYSTRPRIDYTLIQDFFPDAIRFYNEMDRWLLPHGE